MRAAPVLQVRVTQFGVWHAIVRIVGLLALITLSAWIAQHLRAQPWPAAASVLIIGTAAFAAALWLIAGLSRMPAFQLRWDGLSWYFESTESSTAQEVTGEPVAGDLSIAIDSGAWLLLRFVPAAPWGKRRTRWLPVQRHGLERQWHGLRCAVYSPRAAPAPASKEAAAQR